MSKNRFCARSQAIRTEQVRRVTQFDSSWSLRFIELTSIFISTAAATANARLARIIPTAIFLSDLQKEGIDNYMETLDSKG